MKGTFNAYGTAAEKVGGSVPVWLGVVSPAPIGGTINIINTIATAQGMINAGMPVHFDMVSKKIDLIEYGNESQANGYIYNDVKPAFVDSTGHHWDNCTAAVVMAHNEGLLISRVPDAVGYDLDALQAAVPNVVLVREPLTLE